MPAFRLVQRDGTDTLHRWPAHEADNLDDTARDTALEITEAQAWELVGSDTVHACVRCFPREAGDLNR